MMGLLRCAQPGNGPRRKAQGWILSWGHLLIAAPYRGTRYSGPMTGRHVRDLRIRRRVGNRLSRGSDRAVLPSRSSTSIRNLTVAPGVPYKWSGFGHHASIVGHLCPVSTDPTSLPSARSVARSYSGRSVNLTHNVKRTRAEPPPTYCDGLVLDPETARRAVAMSLTIRPALTCTCDWSSVHIAITASWSSSSSAGVTAIPPSEQHHTEPRRSARRSRPPRRTACRRSSPAGRKPRGGAERGA